MVDEFLRPGRFHIRSDVLFEIVTVNVWPASSRVNGYVMRLEVRSEIGFLWAEVVVHVESSDPRRLCLLNGAGRKDVLRNGGGECLLPREDPATSANVAAFLNDFRVNHCFGDRREPVRGTPGGYFGDAHPPCPGFTTRNNESGGDVLICDLNVGWNGLPVVIFRQMNEDVHVLSFV